MQLNDDVVAVVETEFEYVYDEAESDETLAAYSYSGEVAGNPVYSFATFQENLVTVYVTHERFSEIPAGLYKFIQSDGGGHFSVSLTIIKASKIRAKLFDLWNAVEAFFQENPGA